MRRVLLLVAVAASMLPLSAARAVTFYCDNVGCLIDAINAANTTSGHDVIELSPRRYVLGAPATSEWPFGPTGLPIVNSPITIRGNGATIQRAGYGCNFPPQPTQVPFRLFVVTSSGSISSSGSLTLEDVTLSGGCALGVEGANPTDRSGSGGAILNSGARLELTRVVLSGNKAMNDGGAIDSQFGTLIATSTTVVNNAAQRAAGGVLTGSFARLIETTVQANASGGDGGGLMQVGGRLDFADGRIVNNAAVGSGGGVLLKDAGRMRLVRMEIHANRATGPGGAGIQALAGSTITVASSTIKDNSCPRCSGGGIALTSVDSSLIAATTIYGNSARRGGGISVHDPATLGTRRLSVNNSTIGLNLAEQGGGIYASSTPASTLALAVLEHVTLASNFAYRDGDSVAVTGGGLVSMTNTMIASTPFSAASNCFAGTSPGIISFGFNLGEDASCNLIHPRDLAGVTAGLLPYLETGLPGGGHFPLRAGSPAIDAARCSFPTDQLGSIRRAPCDIGAIEFAP